MKTQSKLL